MTSHARGARSARPQFPHGWEPALPRSGDAVRAEDAHWDELIDVLVDLVHERHAPTVRRLKGYGA